MNTKVGQETESSLGCRVASLEQRLVQHNQVLDAIFEGSYDGLCVLDGDGVFIAMNSAFEQITGLSREIWIGHSVHEMEGLPGIARSSAATQVMRGVWPASTLVNLRGGQTLLVTANPQLNGRGEVEYIVLNLRNITQLNQIKCRIERERYHRGIAQVSNLGALEDAEMLRLGDAEEFVFASEAMQRVVTSVRRVSDFGSTLLLCGETGSGKGVIAHLIHKLSPRANRAFVEVNCGAIPEGLVESELFGYQPGAFTGSLASGKPGQFELAHGGTLFLDEISELPLISQVKLLKVLDDQTVHRIGSTAGRRVDVRIIAATNKNLRELCKEGKFRTDLLYRLEVVPLNVPPLRERPEDIRVLTYSYLEKYNREFRRECMVSAESMNALLRYEYPGNVRELKHLIARLVLLCPGQEVTLDDLPEHVRRYAEKPEDEQVADVVLPKAENNGQLKARLEETERALLLEYVKRCSSTYEIAKHLGVNQSSVVRKLHKYKIKFRRRAAHSSDADANLHRYEGEDLASGDDALRSNGLRKGELRGTGV